MYQTRRGDRPSRRAARAVVLGVALLALAPTAGAQQSPVSPTLTTAAARVAGSDARAARKPFAALSASAQRLRDSLVTVARAQVGRPYRLGGTSPDAGFDCSGLVRYVMAALAIDVPRTSAQQATRGQAVRRDVGELRPGDLLTFGRGKRVDHIGIYIGNGRYVHASSVAGRVIESPVHRPPAPRIKPWKGARRVLAAADSTPAAPPASSR